MNTMIAQCAADEQAGKTLGEDVDSSADLLKKRVLSWSEHWDCMRKKCEVVGIDSKGEEEGNQAIQWQHRKVRIPYEDGNELSWSWLAHQGLEIPEPVHEDCDDDMCCLSENAGAK